MPSRLVLIGAAVALLAAGCGPMPAESERNQGGNFPKRLRVEHLPNPWQIHSKVISGGMPEGEAAFAQLAELGVKTVISVDGAKPDVELARQHAMRYVHLPHGYSGIAEGRVKELAKAVRDLPGPIYIHCHHGKHRSPTAAAVACVGAGLLDPSVAEQFLKNAGTSDNYQGLYESARAARRFEKRLLDELEPEFPETAKLPPLAEAMVALEYTHDHLKQIAAAGWKTPPKHPDLEPAHEALLVREHFTELLRTREVTAQPERFQTLLRESEADAQVLEDALRVRKDAAGASQAFARLTANCTTCHAAYRDVPQGQ